MQMTQIGFKPIHNTIKVSGIISSSLDAFPQTLSNPYPQNYSDYALVHELSCLFSASAWFKPCLSPALVPSRPRLSPASVLPLLRATCLMFMYHLRKESPVLNTDCVCKTLVAASSAGSGFLTQTGESVCYLHAEHRSCKQGVEKIYSVKTFCYIRFHQRLFLLI